VTAAGDSSGVTPIVLVHAFGSSRRAWATQLEGLSDRHRVVAQDLPGHGQAQGRFTLDRAVESVRHAIDETGGKAHMVGISGGAVVALLVYLGHPAQVTSLILSAGLAHPPRWFALQRAVGRITPEPLLARLLVGMYSGGRAEHVEVAAEDFRRCGKSSYLAGLREISRIDLRPRLREVRVPTLVLCGSKDRANIPLTRELAGGIPGVSLIFRRPPALPTQRASAGRRRSLPCPGCGGSAGALCQCPHDTLRPLTGVRRAAEPGVE